MRYSLAIATVAAVVALTTSSAFAHGIWVAQRHGDFAGHGSTDEAYDPKKITAIKAFDAGLDPVPFKSVAAEDHLLIEADENHAMMTVIFDNGFWTEKTDGTWENKAKTEVQGAKSTGRYFKYATTILGHVKGAIQPHGLDLEIVPLADPLSLKAGDSLTVQVFSRGKPVSDAKVSAEYTTASDEPVLKTDADGKVTIRIRNQGLNVIAASTTEATPGAAEQDEIGRFATLSFSLTHGEE